MAKTAPEFDRFKSLMGRLLRVPKAELERREAEYKKARQAEKRPGPKPKPA